jgi:hypothetical protein
MLENSSILITMGKGSFGHAFVPNIVCVMRTIISGDVKFWKKN